MWRCNSRDSMSKSFDEVMQLTREIGSEASFSDENAAHMGTWPMNKLLRLNCGSGQRPFGTTGDGAWINIDIQKRWNPDVVADIRSMPMFEDNSAEYIVLHHVM